MPSNTRQAKSEADAKPAAETRRRRTQQQNNIETAAARLETALRSMRRTKQRCEGFANHLSGFYEEVDKLTKGKALLEATDLIVEHANNIVREAKSLIKGDTYLDQIKEFVPAGNNPVYPDVLWTARAVQQAVGRFQIQVEAQERDLALRRREAETIVCALRFFASNNDYIASKGDVGTMMDNPAEGWFSGRFGEERFDFIRLDNRDVVGYLSAGVTIADDPQ